MAEKDSFYKKYMAPEGTGEMVFWIVMALIVVLVAIFVFVAYIMHY